MQQVVEEPIPSLWIGHLLLLHDSEEQRSAGVTGWIRQGLSHGARVVYGEAPTDRKPPMITQLHRSGIDVAGAVARRQLVFLPARELYPPDVRRQVVEDARRDGFGSVGLSAEPPTTEVTDASMANFERIEAATEQLCRTEQLSVLCQHPRDSVRPDLAAAVAVHIGGVRGTLLQTWETSDGIAVGGEIDLANADVLAAVVTHLTQAATQDTVRIDLAHLRFLNATGIGALLRASRPFRSDGGRLELVSPQPIIARILTRLKIDQHPGIRIVTG